MPPISCVGVRRKYDDKCRTDPIWLVYKTHYARYMKKKMTTAEFEQWSRRAVELRRFTVLLDGTTFIRNRQSVDLK